MEHRRALDLRRLGKTRYHLALLVVAGIAAGRDDNSCCGLRLDNHIGFLKVPCGDIHKHAGEIAVQARKHRLRLRIAETCVELHHIHIGTAESHLAAFRRDHEPGIEDAAIGYATLLEFTDDRKDDLLLEFRKHMSRNNGCRAVCAHAAGVRSLIAIKDALMVLRTRKKHGVLTIDESENGTLLAVKELLYKHFGAGGTELVPDKHVVDGRLGLFSSLRNNHALACGKTVRLDDDRKSVRRKRGLCRRGISEHLGLARGNACRLHDFLGETLGSLHASAGGHRTERLDSGRLKRIHKPGAQRSLRPDNHEIRTILLAPCGQPGDIIRLQRQTLGDLCHARIARCAPELVFLRILRQTPRNRVFAPATSYN